jgi:hypothetical protein
MRDLTRCFGPVRTFFFKRRLQALSRHLEAFFVDDEHPASYYRNAIYISFAFRGYHEEMVAECVVHELAHALWERLEGRPMDEKWLGPHKLVPADLERFTLLSEGYAVYAQCLWFRDLYPEFVRSNLTESRWNAKSICFRGYHVIRDLVQRVGPQILLEIPARWKNLDLIGA